MKFFGLTEENQSRILNMCDIELQEDNPFSPLAGEIAKRCSTKKRKINSNEIFTIISKYIPNNFQMWDTQCVTYGHCASPEGALLNHSCSPNTIVSFRERTLHFFAIRDISQGEEITHSYIDPISPNRREKLMEDYGFECNCSF
eukprot:UN23331